MGRGLEENPGEDGLDPVDRYGVLQMMVEFECHCCSSGCNWPEEQLNQER